MPESASKEGRAMPSVESRPEPYSCMQVFAHSVLIRFAGIWNWQQRSLWSRSNGSMHSLIQRGICLYAVCAVLLVPACVASAAAGSTCGVDALYRICLQFDLPILYNQVYAVCKPSKDGNSMADLVKACRSLGLSPTAVRLSYEELVNLDSPCIAFVNGNHFVAVVGHTEGKVKVADYPETDKLYTCAQFEDIWQGHTLIVSCTKTPGRPLTAGAPRIEFDRIIEDFGLVPQGEKIKREYLFRNKGQERLILEKISSSCGCVATISSATEVLPGATGSIEVRVDSSGRKGRESYSVAVLSNDPDNRLITLLLAGIIKADVSYSPKWIDFGRVSKGDSVEREIVLIDSDDHSLEIKGLEASSAFISLSGSVIERDNEYPVDGNKTRRFFVRVKLTSADMELGEFKSMIYILTSIPEKPKIEIPVAGEILGDLRPRPSSLFFGFINPGSTVKRSLTVRSVSGRLFKISAGTVPLSGFTVHYPFDAEDSSHEVSLTYSAESEPVSTGRIDTTVKLETTNPLQPVLEVPIALMIRE